MDMKQKHRYFVEESILIDADIDTVWKHMIDWDGYPRWNPFIVKVAYKASKQNRGDKMKFSLVWHDGKTGQSSERMISSSPPQAGFAELKYKYAALIARLGLLRATRIQQLHAKGNQTEYYTKEAYLGILAGLVPFSAVKQGFSAQAKALAAVACDSTKFYDEKTGI